MKGQALSVGAARALILTSTPTLPAEQVPIGESLGRVTAAAICADSPVPGFDNSAMDGFAVRSGDLGGGETRLRIVGESRAGHPPASGPGPGEAVRISTGAMVPEGADAVIPVEQVREEGGVAITDATVEAGDHLRYAGEDLELGAEALAAGTRIGAAEVSVLASLGAAAIGCARWPRLAVLSGGDELLAPGEPPQPGRIYDANRFGLVAMASEAGAESWFAGAMPDDLGATREAIAGVLDADFVVVTGGVSVGSHDHVKSALAELEVEQLFWRVALRPGGPTWAGVAHTRGGGRTLVFGLPGNPVSALVTFRLFVRPALLAASGRDPDEGRIVAKLAEPYSKVVGRAHYLRCGLAPTTEGWRASLTTKRQGSHVLSSMIGADGLAVIPAERDFVAADEEVEVLPL